MEPSWFIFMSGALAAVLGGVSGAAIGGAASWYIARHEWRRHDRMRWDERRAEVYAGLLAQSQPLKSRLSAARNVLLALANGESEQPDTDRRQAVDTLEDAGERIEAISGLALQAMILGGQDVASHVFTLSELWHEIHERLEPSVLAIKADGEPEATGPASTEELLAEWTVMQTRLSESIRRELGIVRP